MQNHIPTTNPDWGFFGTIRHHAEPEQAWRLATKAVASATGCPLDAVREFLDSRHGRHFADDVANGLFEGLALEDAVAAAVTRWMSWSIGAKTARETGIPEGLPYLAGFVTDCEIALDAAA